jgi:hypothetical protein
MEPTTIWLSGSALSARIPATKSATVVSMPLPLSFDSQLSMLSVGAAVVP